MPNSPAVLIIGAGISGLACAHYLRRRGVSVQVLEASDRPGGLIRSVEQNGFHFELGPQTFLSTNILLEMIRKLGIEDQLLTADARMPRYILRGGHLVEAPMSPFALLGTPLFGARTKWRLFTEVFRRAQPPEGDESIAAFVRRKFGDDLLDGMVGPLVSGIYAGDPERLSLRAAFPEVHRFESEVGSVLRGMVKFRAREKSKSAPRHGLCSFRDGMETLPRALAHSLGPALSYNSPVDSLRRVKSNGHGAFDVQFSAGNVAESFSPLSIVVATPCDVSARLLSDLDAEFPEAFGSIEYAPVAVVSTGYAASSVAGTAKGFGFLVPRSESLRMLGTVRNSSIFPGRAPEGHLAMATFVGGATDSEICTWRDQRIADTVCAELAKVMKISAPPVELRVQRYSRAIPQYNLGHTRVIGRLVQLTASQPGLFLAGNYLSGPSIGACVNQAQETSHTVCNYLAKIGVLGPTIPSPPPSQN